MACLACTVVLATLGCGSSHTLPTTPLLAHSDGRSIFGYSPETGADRLLVRGGSRLAVEPAWSPDGSRLAYVLFSSRSRVGILEAGTGKTRLVSHPLGDAYTGYGLTWSPDGRFVAYRVASSGEVWIARADGSGERRVDALRGPFSLGILGWTADGRLVVRTPQGRLAVSPKSGGAAPYARAQRSLSRHVAVRRDAHGNDQVVVVSPAGRVVGRLTADRPARGHVPVRSCCAKSSPDGRWIAFDRNGSVAVVGANGRGDRTVLQSAGVHAWSPDGRYLLIRQLLGRPSLWLYEPSSRRLRKIASSYELVGASWRPTKSPQAVSIAPPARAAPRVVSTPLRSSTFRPGNRRIRDIEPFALPHAEHLVDLSSDGRFALMVSRLDRGSPIRVVDRATGGTRTLGFSSDAYQARPSLSPRGTEVLYREGGRLWRVGLVVGTRRLVGTNAAGAFRWLRDGGVAFVARNGRLVVRRGRATTSYPLPHSTTSIAIAPDGERVLYSRACSVWLAELRTRRVQLFARGTYAAASDAWSPDGTHVALPSSYWLDCRNADGFDWYHAQTALFTSDGRAIDRLPGSVAAWSGDGSYVLTSGGQTGTAVAASQPLVLADRRLRRQSTLLRSRATGIAFPLSGRRIVFGRYDDPDAALRTSLYVGRLR